LKRKRKKDLAGRIPPAGRRQRLAGYPLAGRMQTADRMPTDKQKSHRLAEYTPYGRILFGW
jgi:hypothetical protein